MKPQSRPDTTQLDHRERELELEALVRERMSTGFDAPADDVAVVKFGEAVNGMSRRLRYAVAEKFGEKQARRKLVALLDGTLDEPSIEQLWRVFSERLMTHLAERTVACHERLVQATHALLANPLPVGRFTGDYTFPNLISELLGDETQGRRVVTHAEGMAKVLTDRYLSVKPPIDAMLAHAVLKRARRDRRRYDEAVASEHMTTPLIVPGIPSDRDPRPKSHRERYTREVSWAIPSEEALDAIGDLGPIVEIGAGGGYWAKLLRERGADILAFDKQPDPMLNPEYIARTWGPVAQAEATIAAAYPDRTLLLIWPPADDPMAHEALRSYAGDRVVYIGERWWPAQPGAYREVPPLMGDPAFHQLLDDRWEFEYHVDIPTWEALDDALYVFERRS